ncbi:MAG TPA: NAD/NADP octopine/nopaline dehydrogenase family protein [Actinomycetota bacterium]|nr:NAD/NADP octopine/nopaline dehydrogenase family protein [Actinomycetota bacterium]
MGVEKVAILGAGNGGCAAAADLGSRGFQVRLFNRSRARLEPIIERGGLEKEGATGEGFVELPVVTDDLETAVEGADLVMLTVPISSHPYFAKELVPHLAPEQVLFLNPGHMGGGLFMAHEIHRLSGRTDIRTCETSTLAYGCRMKGPATINIMKTMTNLPFAAFPGKHQRELYELVSPLYPDLVEASHVLETGFLDINAVEHPPQAICNAGWLEHTKGDYLFYYEGTTPSVGRVIDALDRERIAIAEAAGIPTKPFVQVFHEMGYTTARAAEAGSAHVALQESAPNRWVKGPPSLDHRYLHEDVGWGLVPWSELARVVGVATPVMDALITLGGALNDRDYRAEGLTLERLGLQDLDLARLEEYLREGIPPAP